LNPLRISKNNSEYQILLALKTNKIKRNELNEIFVEGIAPIKAAMRAGKTVSRIIYQNYVDLSDWAKSLIQNNKTAKVISIEKQLFNDLSDRTDPSEIIITITRENISLDRIQLKENPFIVVFDRPTNHGNLGSIIRSANAFGVDLLITTGHGVDLYDPAVIRASLGGIFTTEVCHIESIATLKNRIENIKTKYKKLILIGTDSESAISLQDSPHLKKPVVLLLGNEARGLSFKLKDMADIMIKIPMTGSVDSLNVACAASIIIYDIYKNSNTNS
jgi:23S rRNA (uridine2479-2'-O)-methyltransferase